MSEMNIPAALYRIEGTSPESPLAVFRCPAPGKVDVVFARTAKSAHDIAQGGYRFLGVFDRESMAAARRILAKVCQ